MRKAALYGLVVVCVCMLFALSGPSAQRIAPVSGIAATRPSQVEVTNFPAIQAVSGSVNVGNLPAVQTVAGSVQVSNLPTDGDGAVRVSGTLSFANSQVHVVGITTAMFSLVPAYPGPLTLSRGCNAEFVGSRVCLRDEAFSSIPPPPEWSGLVWMTEQLDINSTSACYMSSGQSAPCKLNTSDPDTLPALCCGY